MKHLRLSRLKVLSGVQTVEGLGSRINPAIQLVSMIGRFRTLPLFLLFNIDKNVWKMSFPFTA